MIEVATMEELEKRKTKCVQVNGQKIALYVVNGEVFATQDTCPHEDISLSEGVVEGDKIVCWAHFWEFDIKSGKGLNQPDSDIKTYKTKVEAGKIFVEA